MSWPQLSESSDTPLITDACGVLFQPCFPVIHVAAIQRRWLTGLVYGALPAFAKVRLFEIREHPEALLTWLFTQSAQRPTCCRLKSLVETP